MEEKKTQYIFQESFVSGRWKVRQFDLPNAGDYLWDIENIAMAHIDLINAYGMNIFFDEACQMIANSIYIFQQGFFDAAFYSLRQSIEITLGAQYLMANPDKMKKWKCMEPGFESGKMAKFLRDNEPTFSDLADKMGAFFDNIRNIQKNTNKYVHKQGYKAFYSMQMYSWSDKREDIIHNQIIKDFETTLRGAIGAVAVYRLVIDPLPILLMDEDMMMRTGDFLTQPYCEDFVDKYIGKNAIETYKQTELYKEVKSSLEKNEKQNKAVFEIIHYQIIDRHFIEDIIDQLHLLSPYARLALALITSSSKISQVFIEAVFNYTSDAKTQFGELTFGSSYYEEFFKTDNNFNVPFKTNSFLSRIKVKGEYSYIESYTPLDKTEIANITQHEKALDDAQGKREDEILKWIIENKGYV